MQTQPTQCISPPHPSKKRKKEKKGKIVILFCLLYIFHSYVTVIYKLNKCKYEESKFIILKLG